MIQKILVALDGSRFAETALGPPLDIAERGEGHVHLVSAWDPGRMEAGLMTKELSFEDAMHRYLGGIKEEVARRRDLEVTTRVVTNSSTSWSR